MAPTCTFIPQSLLAPCSSTHTQHSFQVVGPLSSMDPHAVLGLFTWEDGAADADYREIDFEFAR